MAQFSLYVHKSGLKPDSFYLFLPRPESHGVASCNSPSVADCSSGEVGKLPAAMYLCSGRTHHLLTLFVKLKLSVSQHLL